MLETKVAIDDKAFNLVEFSEVSVVQSFVSEDSVNGKEFAGSEGLFISDLLEIARRNSSGMGSE
jgi:hypothetical protein